MIIENKQRIGKMRHFYLQASTNLPFDGRKVYVICVTDDLDRETILNHPEYFGLVSVEPLTRDQARIELQFNHIGIGCYLGSKNLAKEKQRRTQATIEDLKFVGRFQTLSKHVASPLVRII